MARFMTKQLRAEVGRRVSAARRRAKEAQGRHQVVAIGSAAALGLAERQGFELPFVPVIGKAGTYGLAAAVVGTMTKNKDIMAAGTGLLSVAAYQFASGEGPGAGEYYLGEDAEDVLVDFTD